MTGISGVDGCDAGSITVIIIIIIAGSVCSVSHTTVSVATREPVVVITTD